MKNQILKLLHKLYRKDEFLSSFLDALSVVFKDLTTEIERLENLLHFNRLDEAGCSWWENLLGIKTTFSTLSDRQAYIRARWKMSAHNSIELIKNICSSFENGAVEASFTDGKIALEFGEGAKISVAISTLLDLIDEVKPAHIQYLLKYILEFEMQVYSGVGILEVITSGYDCTLPLPSTMT